MNTDMTDPPPPRPRNAASAEMTPLALFCKIDATYIAERIAELHCHAMRHDGELCAKLNRARIGGMIEVLNRMDVEVVCDWDSCTKEVVVLRAEDLAEFKKAKEGK